MLDPSASFFNSFLLRSECVLIGFTPINFVYFVIILFGAQDHLIYATKDAVIGLMTPPTEDRSYLQFMGVVAHAGPIACMEVSHDSKFVVTCSGGDRCEIFSSK